MPECILSLCVGRLMMFRFVILLYTSCSLLQQHSALRCIHGNELCIDILPDGKFAYANIIALFHVRFVTVRLTCTPINYLVCESIICLKTSLMIDDLLSLLVLRNPAIFDIHIWKSPSTMIKY